MLFYIPCFTYYKLKIMKKIFFLMGTVALAITVSSCNSQQQSQTGVYAGTLPCADCSGIQTIIELKSDNSYRMSEKYAEKDENTYESAGSFTWNKTKNTITLDDKNENGGFATQFLAGENTLTQLDMNGNKITGELAGNYVLRKLDMSLVEKYWKLVEINGQTVTPASGNAKEPHIIFKIDGNQVFGNGGCNSFRGIYKSGAGNKISFPKPLASTRMMCINMNTENQFTKVFENTDNYTIKKDTLSLNKADMTPLARFVTVAKSRAQKI